MGKVLNPAKPVNGKKATVTINPETLTTEWAGIIVGKRFKVQRPDEAAYYFVADTIEPTHEGSEYAWVTGVRVNGRGSLIAQVFHLHVTTQGGGERRRELLHVTMVKGSK